MANTPERRVASNGAVTWRVVWRQDGARQRETFVDPLQAAEFRRLVEAHGNRWPRGWMPGRGYDALPDNALTFKQWAERAITARSKASDRTRADYLRDLARHAYPQFGDMALERITIEDVGQWHTHLIDAGLAAKTVQNLHGMVSSIVKDAVNHNPPFASFNPFAGRLDSLPDVRTEEMTFLLAGEMASIMRHVREHYRAFVTVLVGTGLRFGEATALRVRDVDLMGRQTLTVVQAWKRQGDNSYRLGEPKTKQSRRTIKLSTETVSALLPAVVGKRGDAFVFETVTGLPIRSAPFYTNVWAPAVARARVCETHFEQQGASRMPTACQCAGVLDKRPRVHDLRHTHASWLIAAGVNLVAIQRRLGHTSITTTIDRYGHLSDEADDSIVDALDAALSFGRVDPITEPAPVLELT